MAEGLLDMHQAAEVLGVEHRMVRRLVSEHRIDYVKVGRHVRLKRSVLDRWIERQTVPAVDY